MKYLLIGLLIAIVLLIIVLIINTIRFRPNKNSVEKIDIEKVNMEHVVETMQNLIRYKTISNIDKTKVDEKEFAGFKQYLENRYQTIYKNEVNYLGETGILIKIKGQEEGQPNGSLVQFSETSTTS